MFLVLHVIPSIILSTHSEISKLLQDIVSGPNINGLTNLDSALKFRIQNLVAEDERGFEQNIRLCRRLRKRKAVWLPIATLQSKNAGPTEEQFLFGMNEK